MSAKSAHLSTFGTETEAEIRSTSIGWVFWPVKTVSHITYIVLAET